MKNYVVYDIETYKSDRAEEYAAQKEIRPDARLKDPAKIEADIAAKRQEIIERAALSPITGRITCMGLSFNGSFQFFINDDERALLEDIDTFIAGKSVEEFVGKNSHDFDLPFLRVRHMVHQLRMPFWLRKEARHVDIKNYFGRGMGQRGPSMADLEFALDIRRESEKDGRLALKLWEDGQWAQLERYNREDVQTTEAIYLHMEGSYHPTPIDY